MSELLRVLEDKVQIAALLFLTAVYVIRLIWLFRFRSSREKTFPAGNYRAGIAFSMMNIAMPWAMESTRKKPGFYLQFVIFHIGVTASIAASLIIPYSPGFFKVKAVTVLFQLIIGAACIVGLIRLYRRVANPFIRLISTADDYFSLILMILFFASAFFAVPNTYGKSEWPLIIFFGLTALLIIYVPFSKICHYLYYPFTRYFLGRTMGHRGTISKKRRTCLPDEHKGGLD